MTKHRAHASDPGVHPRERGNLAGLVPRHESPENLGLQDEQRNEDNGLLIVESDD